MNALFVPISILVKSKISEKCLINTLMNMLSQSLRGYLRLASIKRTKEQKNTTKKIKKREVSIKKIDTKT